MLVTDLLAPLASRWQHRVQDELDTVPFPVDPSRQHVAGPDPDRVLVFGAGPAIGFGVSTQELGLPGHLARRLAAATGRGAIVDVLARRSTTAASAVPMLDEVRMAHYDAVLVCVGWADAHSLIPVERWRSDFAALVDAVRAASTPSTIIAVPAMRPLRRPNAGTGRVGTLIDNHGSRLDRIAEEVCVRRPGVVHLGAPPSSVGAPRSAADYDAFAERITPMLAQRLDVLALAPLTTAARELRNLPDPEDDRQAALDRSALLAGGSNARLDRLLRSAREQFGISSAAVTLVDGDRVVVKAAVGMPTDDVPRSVAPCDRTIQRDGALIIGDLSGEAIAADGWRFYAGHALESPDGYRIGALCLLDTRTHEAMSIDRHALAEVAARIETELWREVASGPDDAEDPRLARDRRSPASVG